MDSDLSARYLGLTLPSPIVIGACPITAKVERVRQLACCGAGAVVLPSIFEEQIAQRRIDAGQPTSADEEVAAWQTYGPAQDFYNGGPDQYLRTIDAMRRAVAIPVIANMNGWTGGSWLSFATEIEAAGADALELNLHNPRIDGRISSRELEQALVDHVRTVCDSVSIPVAVKLEPFFTSLPNIAWKLAAAGAAGLVLFDHEPQIDIKLDDMKLQYSWKLTPPGAIGLALAGLTHVRPSCPDLSLAASGGIASPGDVLKMLLAGADVAMMTSAVYRDGADVVRSVHDGILNYMERKQISRLAGLTALRSASLQNHTAALERIGYTGSSASEEECSSFPRRKPLLSGDRYGHVRVEPLESE